MLSNSGQGREKFEVGGDVGPCPWTPTSWGVSGHHLIYIDIHINAYVRIYVCVIYCSQSVCRQLLKWAAHLSPGVGGNEPDC